MKKLTYIMLFLLFFFVQFSFGGSSVGYVTGLVVENNVCMVKVGTHNSPPGCCTLCNTPSSATWGDWTFSLDRPDGEAWLALLLKAKVEGLQVYVYGNNTCNVWGDRETARIILVP